MKKFIIAGILLCASSAFGFGWGGGSGGLPPTGNGSGLTGITAAQVGAVTSVVPDIVLPPKVYSVVGYETNIYTDNVIPNRNITYNWNIYETSKTLGVQQNERWTYNPVSAAGNSTVTVNIYRKDTDSVLATASTVLVSKAVTVGNGITRKALFIGDSTTANGSYTANLLTTFSGTEPMRLTLIGTKGSAGNLYEAINGKTVDFFYTDPTSPFYFSGAFNFSTYMSTNSFSLGSSDYVFINLGINDVYAGTDDATASTISAAARTQIEGMITSIHTYNSNIRIGITTAILPTMDQDGFAQSSFNGDPEWLHKRKMMKWNRGIVDQFSSRESVDNVYVVPLHINLNTAFNMEFAATTTPVNVGSSTSVLRQDDGVHPGNDGYKQIADSFYQFMKGQEN
jgi:lysophospholipase L1-like esterase